MASMKTEKKIMATNHMLIERAVKAVCAYGNQPATPDEAREILGWSSVGSNAPVMSPISHAG